MTNFWSRWETIFQCLISNQYCSTKVFWNCKVAINFWHYTLKKTNDLIDLALTGFSDIVYIYIYIYIYIYVKSDKSFIGVVMDNRIVCSVPIEFQPIWEMKNWIFLHSCKYVNYIQTILKITKGVIRSLNSKKDLFYNGQIQSKKDNDLRNNKQKTTHSVTHITLKQVGTQMRRELKHILLY